MGGTCCAASESALEEHCDHAEQHWWQRSEDSHAFQSKDATRWKSKIKARVLALVKFKAVADAECQARDGNSFCESTSIQHSSEITDFAFSPDSRSLFIGGEDASVVLWDLECWSKRINAQASSAVTSVAFCPDGEYVAAGDAASCCTCWRVPTTKKVFSTELGGGFQVNSVAFASRPGPLLAAGLATKAVVLLSVPDGAKLGTLEPAGLVHSIAFSPNGELLAAGCGTEDLLGLARTYSKDLLGFRLTVWRPSEVEGGGDRCTKLVSLPFSGNVFAVAFSPSGKLLAACSEDKVFTFLVDDGFKQMASLSCPAGVRCLAWCSNSRFLASGGEDMQVSVWDLARQDIAFQLPRMKDWVCKVTLSPDALQVASFDFDSTQVVLHPVDFTKVLRNTVQPEEGIMEI